LVTKHGHENIDVFFIASKENKRGRTLVATPARFR
jgi:hypothetical protein